MAMGTQSYAARYRDIMKGYAAGGQALPTPPPGRPWAPGFGTYASAAGPEAPGAWATITGKGLGGSDLLGRLGYPAAKEGVSGWARFGGAGRLVPAVGYPLAGYSAGVNFGQAMGATDPLKTAPGGPLGANWNPGAPDADNVGNAKAATGDIGKNMLIGAGAGAGIGTIVPVIGTAAGALVGAGISGIGTAINDIWGQGKATEQPPAPPAPPQDRATSLTNLMGKVNLPPAYRGRVLESYRDTVEYYKELGGIPSTDPQKPGIQKTVPGKDKDGKDVQVPITPADMESVAYAQAVQMVPMLKQQAAQELAAQQAQADQDAKQRAAAQKAQADYIRSATLLQGALAQSAPNLLTPSNYLVPGEYGQASMALQAIPAMLALGQYGDQQQRYASALQSADVSRTMASLPSTQQDSLDAAMRSQSLQRTLASTPQAREDDIDALFRSADAKAEFLRRYPQYAPQGSQDQSATEAINATK